MVKRKEKALGTILGDARLDKRLELLTDQLSASPASKLSQALGDWSSLKAGYRFVNNDQVSHEAIIETERRATMLKHNSRINDDASVQVKESLAAVQDEVLGLKKELAFYKSIVAPEQSGQSISIQTVQLKKNETDGYQYKIMVSQQGRNDKLVRGTINIRIKGTSKGKSVTYSLSDVSKDVKEPMKFGFKYLQNFEGLVKLPVAFIPDSLHITANPKAAKIKAIDEQYAWSDLTAGGV